MRSGNPPGRVCPAEMPAAPSPVQELGKRPQQRNRRDGGTWHSVAATMSYVPTVLDDVAAPLRRRIRARWREYAGLPGVGNPRHGNFGCLLVPIRRQLLLKRCRQNYIGERPVASVIRMSVALSADEREGADRRGLRG